MFRLSKLVFFLSATFVASSFELGDLDIVFHCFTRSNPQNSVPMLASVQSIVQSIVFDINRPTVFTIHDHKDGVSGNFNSHTVTGHLSAQDVNVIAVDYSPGSTLYTQALGNAPQVGEVIATFISILRDNFGYSLSYISFVGHGIGAHIAGIAAKKFDSIPRIVAIDPPLNGWTHNPGKLSPDDADLVEVLHTTINTYGYDEPLGDLDFYSNGGASQTGCITFECSYMFGYIYYAESLLADASGGTKFVGTKCEDWQQATRLACNGERDTHFGGFQAKNGSGVYLFLTNPLSPHARG